MLLKLQLVYGYEWVIITSKTVDSKTVYHINFDTVAVHGNKSKLGIKDFGIKLKDIRNNSPSKNRPAPYPSETGMTGQSHSVSGFEKKKSAHANDMSKQWLKLSKNVVWVHEWQYMQNNDNNNI